MILDINMNLEQLNPQITLTAQYELPINMLQRPTIVCYWLDWDW